MACISVGKQANSSQSRGDPGAVFDSREQAAADPPAREDRSCAGGAAEASTGAAHAARGKDSCARARARGWGKSERTVSSTIQDPNPTNQLDRTN